MNWIELINYNIPTRQKTNRHHPRHHKDWLWCFYWIDLPKLNYGFNKKSERFTTSLCHIAFSIKGNLRRGGWLYKGDKSEEGQSIFTFLKHWNKKRTEESTGKRKRGRLTRQQKKNVCFFSLKHCIGWDFWLDGREQKNKGASGKKFL